MKAKTIYRILTEAARFGNKEKRMVLQHKNEFRIGVEYEFHVRPEFVGGEEDVVDTAMELMANDYNGSIDAAADEEVIENNNIIDELTTIIAPYGVMKSYSSLVDAFDKMFDLSSEFASEYISSGAYLVSLQRHINETEFWKEWNVYLRIVNALKGLDDDILEGLNNFDSAFRLDYGDHVQAQTLMNEVKAALETNDNDDVSAETVSSALRDVQDYIEGDASYLIDKIDDYSNGYAGLEKLALQVVSSSTILQSESNELRLDVAVRMVENDPDRYSSGGSDPVEFVEDTYDEHISSDVVDGIDREPSVPDGAELVTLPLSVDETFGVMSDVFDYIEEYGSTSNKTGMHVNISHKNFRTMTDVNLLKILILTDPDFMQSIDRGVIKWRERNHMVAGIYNELRNNWNNILNRLMSSYDSGGIEEVESTLRNTLVRGEKFKSVNFTYMLGENVTTDGSRIEFRFFGGSGYEDRIDDIERDIYFLCYTVLSGIDEDFLRREYLSDLVRLLNKISMEFSGVTFVEFYNQWKIDGDVGVAQLSIVDKFERKGYNYKG